MNLLGEDGRSVAWEPNRLAARAGGVEVYKRETMELRAGDRIRWTRNDMGLGLVNSQTAEVSAVKSGAVTFRLEDGRMLDLAPGDPQLRHVDRAWASTVHAFQGRTVDTVIAAMEANHPNLTTQKTLYVEISRARDRAELVTDDRAALKERLEAVTGERIAASKRWSRNGRRAARPDWTRSGARVATTIPPNRGSGSGHRSRTWRTRERRRASIAIWGCDRGGRIACRAVAVSRNPRGPRDCIAPAAVHRLPPLRCGGGRICGHAVLDG